MSEKTTEKKTPLITTVGESQQVQQESESKQNFWQRRIVTPVKNHPKIATAVTAGVALIGLAAVAGRKTAPTPDFYVPLELEPAPVTEEELLSESTEDTTVA